MIEISFHYNFYVTMVAVAVVIAADEPLYVRHACDYVPTLPGVDRVSPPLRDLLLTVLELALVWLLLVTFWSLQVHPAGHDGSNSFCRN